MSRRAFLLFIGLGIAWGIPYLLIKIAVRDITPAQLVLGRTAVAAVLLLPFAFGRGAVLPVLRAWRPLLVYTLVEIAIPWLTLGRAETRLPSATSGLLIAAVPLVGLLIAFVTGRAERMGRSGWAGLLVGIAGVAALVGFDVGGSDLGSVGLVGITVVGYALGPAVLSRYLGELPGLGVVALSLTIAALIYIPVVLIGDGVPSRLPPASAIWSVVLLATICTAAAFLMLFGLVGEIGPVRATTITYVNPAVAVAAGAIVLGEQITVWTVVGFALVITGSFLVNRCQPAPEPAELGPLGADEAVVC